MKILFSVFVCLLVVDNSFCIKKKVIRLPQQEGQDVAMAISACMPDSGIPLEDLVKVVEGGYIDTEKFRKFLLCCYGHAKFLLPDGHVHLEKMLRISRDPVFVDGVTRCAQLPGSTTQEHVFNFFRCFQDTVPVKLTI